MSETKQEGDFSLKGKKMKTFSNEATNEPVKVDLSVEPTNHKEPDVTKVVIPQDEQDTPEEPTVVNPQVADTAEDPAQETSVIQEVTDEENLQHTSNDQVQTQRDALPDNVEKLITFMNETGGSIDDYVRLNADYSNVDEDTLLKEYYKKTKPYLEAEDLEIMLEDFSYDEELDEERDIRKKKLAYKEEIAKAKGFLEETKDKYYAEIKSRPSVNEDQQKALDFFNRYNQQQAEAQERHDAFKTQTSDLFSDEFKGFDFNLGEKKFRYGVKDPSKVAENQSNINNILGKFLNEDGSVKDTRGYHKAMYAADNIDTIANHFYEQGKADAVKEVVDNSKNPSTTHRQPAPNEFKNGIKARVINPDVKQASKLSIKKIRI